MMKKILFLLSISICTVSHGFASDDPLLELEQELLSLEDEFSESSETPVLPESEDSLPEGLSLSLAPDCSDTLAFLADTAVPTEEEPKNSSLPAAPHEERARFSKTAEPVNGLSLFRTAPFIYSLLLGMSLTSIAICFYVLSDIIRQTNASESFAREALSSEDGAFLENLCRNRNTRLSKIVLSGIRSGKYGIASIREAMKIEGKRVTLSSWQLLGILHDIAVVSPMIGLLGTVIGLFHAFYDLNRSLGSLSRLLDGLGISIGTTVAGIAVAVLSMILHSIVKFRLIRSITVLEEQASLLAIRIPVSSEFPRE